MRHGQPHSAAGANLAGLDFARLEDLAVGALADAVHQVKLAARVLLVCLWRQINMGAKEQLRSPREKMWIAGRRRNREEGGGGGRNRRDGAEQQEVSRRFGLSSLQPSGGARGRRLTNERMQVWHSPASCAGQVEPPWRPAELCPCRPWRWRCWQRSGGSRSSSRAKSKQKGALATSGWKRCGARRFG
jgi:hypothetical protein